MLSAVLHIIVISRYQDITVLSIRLNTALVIEDSIFAWWVYISNDIWSRENTENIYILSKINVYT